MTWNDVNKLDISDWTFDKGVAEAHGHPLLFDTIFVIDQNTAVSDVIVFFVISRHVDDISADLHGVFFFGDLVVWRLKETEIVDASVESEIGNETDVWTFRGTDWINSGVL